MIDAPEDLDFAAAMTPKKRGRPPKPKAEKKAPEPKRPSSTYIDIRDNSDINMMLLGGIDKENKENKGNNIKDKLTRQELTFLDLFFNSPRGKGENRVTIDKCMISAGYGDYSQDIRYRLARKIVQKYETATPEARKVFQALGYGPVMVALGIIDHAENSPATVSLNALKLAASCQGMIEQSDNPAAGITINLNLGPGPGPASGPPAAVAGVFGAPDEAQPPPPPRKPLQITR